MRACAPGSVRRRCRHSAGNGSSSIRPRCTSTTMPRSISIATADRIRGWVWRCRRASRTHAQGQVAASAQACKLRGCIRRTYRIHRWCGRAAVSSSSGPTPSKKARRNARPFASCWHRPRALALPGGASALQPRFSIRKSQGEKTGENRAGKSKVLLHPTSKSHLFFRTRIAISRIQ